MSNFTQDFDQTQHSNIIDDDNFENDDLVTFQHDSKTINLFFSQLIKYSKHIRESYLFSDVINRLPQELRHQIAYGGLSGENCYYMQSLQSQGAGTQTGSTCGFSEYNGRQGDPGLFGLGVTGKYNKGCHSGGGGGGGWYGGGSGGYGNHSYCSSGGGGSGWTFTESSLAKFKSGDSSNSSKFELNSTYFLKDTICAGGNEEFPRPDGNGNERGHIGNGYAKITPL